MVLSYFTPNYPQRKGTFLDTIFIPTSPPPPKKKRERNKPLPDSNKSTKEGPSLSLDLSLLFRKPTSTEKQLYVTATSNSSWFRKSARPVPLSKNIFLFWFAETLSETYGHLNSQDGQSYRYYSCLGRLGRCSYPHFKHEETIIWRGWIFPSVLFPWAQPIFTEM